MTARTARLHEAFLGALGSRVSQAGNLREKPLCIDLRAPHLLRLRLYMYSLVGGTGERARREYKIVLRVRDQAVGAYGTFDHSDGRFTMVVGYATDLDVFVLWDASLHPRFKNGGNLQVRDEVVRTAAACGTSEQIRRLTSGANEVVLACQSPELWQTLKARIGATGGLGEGECQTFPN
jgi:hypothetical protein